ncbi:GntR family transcriptional regulator [Novosphingobium aerophilum]|uniref:GntR family transcriptional regulator n=1 Tax=Novosphingobium aerophilum TaxID=2839843 RepID=A0A7X1KAY5_9SPHN|nr:GntR family transcriptional regulator [Novosphingobium aerophilum]MBC2650512.1 GntR family transcriptional regulator [Novosphingobium aerophilum]
MEKSHLIETEPVTGNIDEFYEFVSGESRLAANAPGHTAWEMESLTALLGWPVGEVIGREAELREQFGVSRETFREALRIVESRGSLRMRRGWAGGLSVERPQVESVATAFAAFLSANGITQSQVKRGAWALDRMLIERLKQRRGPFPMPVKGEAVREWLARAADETLLSVYARALGRLSLTEETVGEVASTLAVAGQIAAALSCHDYGAALRLLSLAPIEHSNACEEPSRGTSARAANVAMRIIRQNANAHSASLGSEAVLRTKFDPSRAVIRQAVRILQDLDVLEARKGRGGGYELKQPSAVGVIRQFFPLLASEHRTPAGLVDLMWDINAVNLRQAAVSLFAMEPAEQATECRGLQELIDHNAEPQRFILLQQAFARLADSPMLDTLALCVVSYQIRMGGTPTQVPTQEHYRARETDIVRALIARDAGRAEQTLRQLQAEITEIALQGKGISMPISSLVVRSGRSVTSV